MSRIFGPIRQNGYVVRDLKAAMRHWSEVMGVGPWFVADPAPLHDFRYRGEPSGCVVALALANAGPLQIELIEQLNDGPSLYKDFLDAGLEGLQHVAFWTTRYDDEVARAESLGFRIGHSGERHNWAFRSPQRDHAPVKLLADPAKHLSGFDERLAR